MWTASADAATALMSGGISVNTIVNVITPTGVVNVPVFSDSTGIQYSLQSRIGRVATLAVSRDVLDAGLMNALTDHVYINVEVVGSPAPDIPLGYFRPLDVVETSSGLCSVRCVDAADDVVSSNFPTPWYTNGGSYSNEITSILRNVDPTFILDVQGGIATGTAPTLAWESDRGQALDDLASGANAVWQTNRVGGFTLYASPYSYAVTPPSVMLIRDGANGTLVEVKHTRSRAGVYNAITLIVERTDGSAPISITVFDNDPNSNTRYGGPFGRRNHNIKRQVTTDLAGAQTLALIYLRQSLALTELWEITLPYMPLLDQGDIISVWYRDVVSQIVVETITFSPSPNTPTRITGRKLLLVNPQTIGVAGTGV